MTDGQIIDTTGLKCPLPVLKVRKLMRGITPGETVTILATDPGAEQDLKDYCEASGCAFLSAGTGEDGVLKVVIRKS